MIRTVKNIGMLMMCLLLVCGAANVHFYVITCAHSHHALQVALSTENHNCCHDDGDDDICADMANGINSNDECCSAVSQAISVNNFQISQLQQQQLSAIAIVFFGGTLHTCDVACSHALTLAYAPPIFSPQEPDIYQQGQLRL